MQDAPEEPLRKTSTKLKAFMEGRARLRAIGANGPAPQLLEALLTDLENRPPAPASQSARTYHLVYEVTAGKLVKLAKRAGEERETLQARVQERLDLAPALQIKRQSSGSNETEAPNEKASSRANKITVRVLKRVLADLKAHAEKYNHHASAWVVFYICSASRIGWRPCELQGAHIEGDTLFINTAKLRMGNVQVRHFPLDKVPDNSRFAAKVICDHLPEMGWLQFQRWRNRLSEALSQSCDRLGIDRISLYACRHIALQTWRAAGMSKAQIAQLAGHMNLRTAGRHYGGRSSRDWLHGTPLDQPGADLKDGDVAVAGHAEIPLENAHAGPVSDQTLEVDVGESGSVGPGGAGLQTPQQLDHEREIANLAPYGITVQSIAPFTGTAQWRAHRERIEDGGRRADGLPAAATKEAEPSGAAPRFDPKDFPEPPKARNSQAKGAVLWNEYKNRLAEDGKARAVPDTEPLDSLKPG